MAVKRCLCFVGHTEVTLLFKFNVSSFSMTGDIQILKLLILLTSSSSKLIVILLKLGKSKLTLLVCFTDFGQVKIILQSLGKTLDYKKTIPTLSLQQKIQEPQLKNKIQRLSLLFLSLTRFSHLYETQPAVFRTQPKIYGGSFLE